MPFRVRQKAPPKRYFPAPLVLGLCVAISPVALAQLSAHQEEGEARTAGRGDATAADLSRAEAIEGHLVDVVKSIERMTVAIYGSSSMMGRRSRRGNRSAAPVPAPAPQQGQRFPQPMEGGSGVVVDVAGYVVTNHHVIADAEQLWVGIPGRGKFWARVSGVDEGGDLALLKIQAPENLRFDAAPLGDSDAVRVGEMVIASGNPFMLSLDQRPTVTFGVVSGLHRYQGGSAGDAVYGDALQIDASINPGNSGGPLWNMRGELIGVNGRISVRDFRERWNIGVGFAIPINQVKLYLPALKQGLRLSHGFLGVSFSQAADKQGGARVAAVEKGSAAEKAGLRAQDVIVEFNDRVIESSDRLRSILSTLPEGAKVRMTVLRGDQRRQIETTLERRRP